MKIKNAISLMLSTVMLLSFPISSLAKETAVPTQTFEKVKTVYSANGDIIGIQKTVRMVETQKNNNGLQYTITKANEYKLNEKYAAIPEYKEKYVNTTDIDTYTVTKSKEILRNGLKVDDESSSKFDMQISPMANDEGGVPRICHYYDANDYTNYFFGCYNDMSYTGNQNADPAGSNIQKTTTSSAPAFIASRTGVDYWHNDYADWQDDFYNLSVTAMVSALSWGTLVGFLGTAGPLGILATICIDSWYEAEDSLSDAYGHISRL